jgi:hypothetical protein
MVSDDIKLHLQAVLDHYCEVRNQTHAQVSELQAKLKEQQNTIASLAKELYGSSVPPSVNLIGSMKYANISVRWAILDVLESGPLATADIADILKREGVTTKAANFTNNVSAVLSTTMKGVDEVRQTPDGKWELTEKGQNAIYHIRPSPKFKKSCPWATAPAVASASAATTKGGTNAAPLTVK